MRDKILALLKSKLNAENINVLRISASECLFEVGESLQQINLVAKSDGDPELSGEPKTVEIAVLPTDQSLTESEVSTDLVEVSESFTSTQGKVRMIKVMKAGQGAMGYYPKHMIMRDGPKVFKKGTHMYINHQTEAERNSRPEGDLRHLAGVLTKDAQWMENGPDGPGLYAESEIFKNFRENLNELAPHIGVSIRAVAKGRPAQVGGRATNIIEEFVAAKSVDFVTRAGAGGKVLQVLESAFSGTSQGDNNDDRRTTVEIDEKELKELREAADKAKTLETQVAQIQESARKTAANAIVVNVLASDVAKSLRPATKKRIENLAAAITLPLKEGALDESAYKSAVEQLVKDEVAYLSEAAGSSGTVMNMGPTHTPKTEDKQLSLAEAEKLVSESMKGLR